MPFDHQSKTIEKERILARHSEESVTRSKREISVKKRSRSYPADPEEIRKNGPLQEKIEHQSRVRTPCKSTISSNITEQSKPGTLQTPKEETAQHNKLRRNSKASPSGSKLHDDESKKTLNRAVGHDIQEPKSLCKTLNDQGHSYKKVNKNAVKKTHDSIAQVTANGAKGHPVLKGEGQDTDGGTKNKPVSEGNVVRTKKNNQRSKIPVFEHSKALNGNGKNESFKVQRKMSSSSEKLSSCCRDIKSSTESLEKKGNKSYDEFMDIKLSSSHSLQRKSSTNRSVIKQSPITTECTVMPGRVLASSAARKLEERMRPHTETGAKEIEKCSCLYSRTVGQNNQNNVTVDNPRTISDNRGTADKNGIPSENMRKSYMYVKKSSRESSVSEENKRGQIKATKPGKIAKKNANRRSSRISKNGSSSESNTKSSDESQSSHLSFSEDDDVMEEYPPPKPPSVLKSTAFSNEGFDTINDHVLKASSKEAESFTALLEYLCRNMESDVARVRAIYCWIVSQRLPIIDDVTDIPSSETPFGYLYLIMQRKRSYAELFCKMCRHINIPCVVIHGISKGVTYDVGEAMNNKKHRNSWNAVYIKENWRLVHCHWASKSAKGYRSGKWVTLDCPEYRKDAMQGESRSYIVRTLINDWYFFTEPSVFINKCFPFDDRWQLLPKKITKVEFEARPFLQPAFYALRLELVDQNPSCVAHVHGKYILQIRMPIEARDRLHFSYNLYCLRDFADEGEYEYPSLERYTLHYCLNDVAFFEIRFPPISVGEYKLQIYCCDNEICLPSEWICDFKVVSEKGMNVSVPLPVVPRIGWGMNSELAKHNITAVSHTGGLYFMDDGVMTFVFIFPEETDARAELVKNGRSKSDFVENVKVEKNGVDVRVILEPPCQGEFALQIFCREQGTQNDVNVCNYLLERTLFAESKLQDRARKLLVSATSRTTPTLQELSDAIEKFVNSGAKDQGELEAARKKLNKLKLREELMEAIGCRSLDKLEKALKNLSDAKSDTEIGVDNVSKAEKLLSHLRRLRRFQAAVLEMDSKTISELRSYHKPPLAVHGVMVATYVLLGVDEKEMRHWFGVQNLIGKTGRESLKKRVENFDVKSVSLENLHRAKELLKDYDLSIVQDASAGAATFYQWAINMIKDIEEQEQSPS